MYLSHEYRIAGNFQGRKLSRIGEKYDFHGEYFRGLLTCAVPKMPHPQKKTYANSHKTAKFTKVFSFESFPLYGTTTYPAIFDEASRGK